MYRLSAYYVAKSVSEIPLVVLQPVIFWTIVYWMAGLDSSVRFIASVLLLVLSTITAQVRELSLIAYRTGRENKSVKLIQSLSMYLCGHMNRCGERLRITVEDVQYCVGRPSVLRRETICTLQDAQYCSGILSVLWRDTICK